MVADIEAKKIGSRQGLLSAGIGLLIALLLSIILAFVIWKIFFANLLSLIQLFDMFIVGMGGTPSSSPEPSISVMPLVLNTLVGIIIFFLCSHLYGKNAAVSILLKKKNHFLIGIRTGILVLITTAFLVGWTGFFQAGIGNIGTDDNPFIDYIFKPFFWISVVGFVPSLLVGLWFGKRVHKKGLQIEN